jgi:hypothetical protein
MTSVFNEEPRSFTLKKLRIFSITEKVLLSKFSAAPPNPEPQKKKSSRRSREKHRFCKELRPSFFKSSVFRQNITDYDIIIKHF